LNKINTVSKKRINIKKLSIFLIVLFLLSYISYTFVSQHIKLAQREKIATDYEEKILDEKLEGEQLKKELENSKSDEYREKMAREKLGLVKPNERVFIDVTKE